MSRCVGTVSRGIRTSIIRKGDNLPEIVLNSVLEACENDGIKLHDRDIVGVTEAVVARAQGNYATIGDIASDVKSKFKDGHIGVIWPILSRNRFAVCLKGIAKGAEKITLMLAYPSDEVGNHLISLEELDKHNVVPYLDTMTEKQFRDYFGFNKHVFTGVDYMEYYKEIIEEQDCEIEVILSNRAEEILKYTKNVINCDIHTRKRTKNILLKTGGETVLSLDEIMTSPVNNSGYNAEYGLLGSNKASEDTIKLFPRNSSEFANKLQKMLMDKTGKKIEVLVYGDGAFKDPVGKIWELADPVVSPGYTDGLVGKPNELKLKYLADNDFADLSGDSLKEAIVDTISHKEKDLVGQMSTEGKEEKG